MPTARSTPERGHHTVTMMMTLMVALP